MKNYILRFSALAALLALLTVSAGANEIEPRYRELPNFHRVNARLYRGAQPEEGGIRRLKELGVETIINLRKADSLSAREREEAVAAGMKYYNIPLPSRSRPHDADVEEVLRLIDDPGNGVVFVHCRHGKDRTGTVIACHRIMQDHWTSAQAKKEARHYGMSPFQIGMKHYIRSFYEQHGKQPPTTTRQPSALARTTAVAVRAGT